MNKIVRYKGQGGDTMATMVLKLKKTNYLAIVLIMIIALWQGYGIYQGTMMGLNIEQYMYTKVIVSVMPGASLPKQPGEVSGLNRIFYFLTDIDVMHYRTFIERNIPMIKYTALLSGHETSQNFMGISYYKAKDKSEAGGDYFAQDEELVVVPFEQNISTDQLVTLDQLVDDNYVLQKLINFDANLNYENQAMKLIDVPQFAQKRFKLDKTVEGPQVLILHTHSMERFAGEEPGSQGVVDLGRYLKQILETQYGLSALHCTSSFDVVDNQTERTGSYERMEPVIEKIIKENPSIQVVMDIHRDGIDSTDKFLGNVNGESAAKIMFVNGFCQVQQNGILTPVTRLPNPYIEDNMALSLQLQLKANELYPGLMRKTLVKPYRYSLHMKPMSLLIEVGNQNNTKEEALTTMEALGEILMDVIEKD